MSNSVPSGSIVTYNGHWPHTELLGFGSADKVISDVSNALIAQFQLYVLKSSNSGGFIASATGTGFDVTLQLEVDNGLGYGSSDDIILAVRSAVESVLGDYPTSDSIPFIQVPGSSPKPTGQPGQTDNSSCIAGSSSDVTGLFSISCWFKNLTTTGFASVGVLTILVVLGIGIFIFAFDKIPSLPRSRA